MKLSPELKRGVIEIIREEELLYKIRRKGKLRIKWGADPTAPDIHLGHAVVLKKLRQFQDEGHKVVFIIGDYTGAIGDPSGQSKTRPSLPLAEVRKNAETYMNQIHLILKQDKDVLEVRYNSEWLEKLKMDQLTSLAAQFTVSQVLERADFHNRFEREEPISLHEFLYPIYQGYDSVQVEADVEIGGTDQKWNMMVGRTLQSKRGEEPQVVITMPLLEGTDGTQKMSKSLGNYIGVTDKPEDIYGKVMSIPDALMTKYCVLLLCDEELAEKTRNLSGEENMRDVKAELAFKIVQWLEGSKVAEEAQAHFNRVVRDKTILDEDRNKILINDRYLTLGEIVKVTQRAVSNTSANNLIKQKAVRIDGVVKINEKEKFSTNNLRVDVGKYHFLILCNIQPPVGPVDLGKKIDR